MVDYLEFHKNTFRLIKNISSSLKSIKMSVIEWLLSFIIDDENDGM